jgi:hypothetical protein
MPYVRTATRADVEYLGPRLRSADVDEVRAMGGVKPLTALTMSFHYSDTALSICTNDDLPMGMFGVTRWDDRGMVWMLASDELLKHSRIFLRQSRDWVKLLNDEYPVLFNYVDERNTVHIRWIKWCGFTFINRHERMGVERRPFLEFVRIKPCASE